jgi:hypothetical protein
LGVCPRRFRAALGEPVRGPARADGGGAVMGDYADYMVEQEIERRVGGAERREQAAVSFPAIQEFAALCGVTVTKRTDAHYQIRKGNVLLNVYPGNRRIARDKRHGSVYLDLPDDWTLEDAVKAFIEATEGDTSA